MKGIIIDPTFNFSLILGGMIVLFVQILYVKFYYNESDLVCKYNQITRLQRSNSLELEQAFQENEYSNKALVCHQKCS